MIPRSLWMVAAWTTACGLTAAQDGEAPAIAQGGIGNRASLIPVQQPMGGAAPGSLISIRGFRLGPAAPGAVRVRIRRGEARVETAALSVNENEIEAIVPDDAPLGSGTLQVVRNGHASLEWPIEIVASSFGAFSRNGHGWGPGEISNADGAPNSGAQPAKPGEEASIAGTGLGLRTAARSPPQVLVAGRPAVGVRIAETAAARPGVDTIAFQLPKDTPEGCQVPVQVSSAQGLYSNSVTMAVSREGSQCIDRSAWAAGFGKQKLRLATVGLVHADLEMGATPKDTSVYPMDAGFASFSEIERDAPVNPLFLFPPVGTCTTYSGTASLHTVTSPLALLEALRGKPLDAGPSVTVRGLGGEQLLAGTAYRGRYWQILGGHPPLPGIKALPLFLTPGDYQVTAPGGAGVGAFGTTIRAESPLIWRNRKQLGEVERTRGTTVTWLSPARPDSKLIVIVAMNQDSRSGALGVCACLAKASSGSFQIPPYALANIPPTPAHPRGFPLNLIMLLELPEVPITAATGTGVDRVLAFAASISGRTVQFK
jgi:uncharacterized protein (TIGR03437 family)